MTIFYGYKQTTESKKRRILTGTMMKTTITMMKMRAWYSAKITPHQPLSKQLQHKILQLKWSKTLRTPKMVAITCKVSLSFKVVTKMPTVVLETPLSLRESGPRTADPTMATVLHSNRCNNSTTMIVWITVVAEMTEVIVDTKAVKIMVAATIIITDAMTTMAATVVTDVETTSMEMTGVAEATAATERIDAVATITETEEVAQATMIKVATGATVVSRIVVPEETITVNNSHMISLIVTKLIQNLTIVFTIKTTPISSAEP